MFFIFTLVLVIMFIFIIATIYTNDRADTSRMADYQRECERIRNLQSDETERIERIETLESTDEGRIRELKEIIGRVDERNKKK